MHQETNRTAHTTDVEAAPSLPAADTHVEQIERVIAALPDAINKAMKTALPAYYTPKRAADFAETMAACLRQDHTSSGTPCPDNIPWCLGAPANHADPREHRHEGAEYGLTGSYVDPNWTKSLVAFQLVQWDDNEPRLVFQSDGTWPDLGLSEVDELIGDAVPWLTALIATRRRLAIELQPSWTPFEETGQQQTTSAAVGLATRAMDVALANTADRAETLSALRAYLDQAEAEQAGENR